jgi:nucleoid DNA-binding protein
VRDDRKEADKSRHHRFDQCQDRNESQDIHAVIDLFIEEIKTALTEGRVVELRGFGTFEIRVRKGRKKARNPRPAGPYPSAPMGLPLSARQGTSSRKSEHHQL